MHGAKLTERIFDVMTLFFGAVALMTLSLGGIGVINIMLVSVTERIREIGVRKALGATAGDIQRQFFAESATLTILSGAIGLVLGFGICLILQRVTLPEFIPPPAVGVISGFWRALKAAQMEPVEALRYE